ncbi:tyrosine-type recombinase/integrase [Desulfosarcina ovata]|uniref:Tyr recombinase domain-containing protein n=1 Tax=Desulfosarcina ovata subsp. ovata TaxID=2752305 RepID=A0A5K8A6D7_9BACT|nr:site-specific integrase [Desulfosarcina ovata]BBO88182.1 hypothetical protein DSCOOX_13620 [Desulfosarcina ovata subsp. ovata]
MAKPFKVEGRTGIFYRIAKRIGGPGEEKVYYVRFKRDGKIIETKVGRQYADNMTPAKAERLRSLMIEGRKQTGQEKRVAQVEAKKAAEGKYTIGRLWAEYLATRKPGKALITDCSRYKQYLEKPFGKMEPDQILPLDVERLKRHLLKSKSPQTVKHVLNLLTWIVNFGVKNGLSAPLPFRIKKPTVHNQKTEDLTPSQIEKLLDVIDQHPHPQAGNVMKLALYSGMRQSEMFKLQWRHIDFERGFIEIVDPKGVKPEKIPLNTAARELLEGIPRTKGSPYVFPGRGGRQLTNLRQPINEIKKAAGLPADFRPLHGLRHVFATQLASSGQVDMYTLQRLLTHKTPIMTQRYAHLRDEALKRASELAGNIVTSIASTKAKNDAVNE